MDPMSVTEKSEKSEVEVQQVERVPSLQWAERDALDVEHPKGILGWILKKNPSPQFIADVAKMNETPLDPVQVKRLERKIDLLIIPALAICYMVCAQT